MVFLAPMVTLAMLAMAFLAVTTAAQRHKDTSRRAHRDHCQRAAPTVRRPAPAAGPQPGTTPPMVHSGADDTKPEPAPATTDSATNHHDHELRLQY